VNATSDHGSPLTSAVPSADADAWPSAGRRWECGCVRRISRDFTRIYIYIYVLYVWDNYICRYYIHVYTVCIIYILSYILNTNVSIRSFMGMRTGNHTSRSLRGWPVLFSRWGSPLEREATSSISRVNFGTFWNVVHLYTFIYIYIHLYIFIYIYIHLYTFIYIYDSFMPAILSFWTVWALEVPQLVSIWNLTFFSHYSKGETDFVAVFWLWNAPLLSLFILQIAALVNGCTFSFDRLTVLSFF
jgi:hypothetical protein